ncbi:MAG TPA: hypothetical protein VEP50_19025 [bacterium]|nr:hypothetical protein [bacterium]
MRGAVTALQMLIRLVWVVQVVLGMLLWAGRALRFLPVHMLVGVVFVLLLWMLSALVMAGRVRTGLTPLTVLWGALTLALGLTQTRLMIGGAHWVVQVLHLLVGIGGIVLAERLAAKVKRGWA